MTKCGGCGKFLSGGASCTKCKAMFHRQCVSLTTTNQTPKNWLCPCCVVNAPRKDNTNTPLKELAEQESEDSPLQCSEGNEQLLLLEEIRALRNDMSDFRKEFGSFRTEVRDELRDLREMYQSCNSRMDALGERLDQQDLRLNRLEACCDETHDLKMQLHILKQELHSREQLALHNDIEISGVTEIGGENTMHITGLIMNKIGVKVDERDVVIARRVGPVRVGQDGKQRPRPIVMRVTRRAVTEQVLRGARTRRNISTGDIELSGTPRPIYINERLTKENRLLFGRARTLTKQNKWKFSWTREGKIFIREEDGKPAFRIRSEHDLDRIFKLRSSITN